MKLNRNYVAFFFLAAAIAIPAFAQSGVDTYRSKCLMCIGMDLGAAPVSKLTGDQTKSVLAYIRTLK